MPHPARHKHPRLRGYDYCQVGAYFVTICTHHREHLFGRVINGSMASDPIMELNDAGRIVQQCWDALPLHYPVVQLDAFQVMPNHVHGIILIVASTHASTDNVVMDPDRPGDADPDRPGDADPDRPGDADPERSRHADPGRPGHADPERSRHADPERSRHADPERSRHAATARLGNIVGSFKSAVAKAINDMRGTPGAPVWQKGYHDRIIRDDAEHDRIAQYIAENPGNWLIDPDNIL